MDHDDGTGFGVELWTSGTTHPCRLARLPRDCVTPGLGLSSYFAEAMKVKVKLP